MKLTLDGTRQNLRTLIQAVLGASNSFAPYNCAYLSFFLPDIAANGGGTVSWGDSSLVLSTNVGEKGSMLPAQRIPIYEFDSNQGSLADMYVQSSAASMVLDVDYKMA